jgi:hypothetical protein
MTGWKDEELAEIGGAGELEIAPMRRDDPVFDQPATFTSDLSRCGSNFFGNLFPGQEVHCGNDIAPGTYQVTEDAPTGAGNAFVSLSCDDQNSTWDLATRTATIHLEADETVRCVFVNTNSA